MITERIKEKLKSRYPGKKHKTIIEDALEKAVNDVLKEGDND